MHLRLLATVIAGLASAAPAEPLETDVDPIIVRGNPSEKYRIPEELRRLQPEKTERWRKQVDRDLGCQKVGPRGCGTPVVPIFTIKGDGSTQIGSKPDPNNPRQPAGTAIFKPRR